MITRRILPGEKLRGRIRVPGDKSISHRAVILSSLAEGESEILGLLTGEDCARTVQAFQAMGVGMTGFPGERVRITGVGLQGLREPEDVLDAGNSGTTIRLLAGLLAGQPFFSVLTGDASLRRRPMARVVEPLEKMGARLWGRAEGHLPPLAIRGGLLRGIHYALSVASAQVKSALLLAALYAQGTTVVEEPAASRDHTERMLRGFGVPLQCGERTVSLTPPVTLRGHKIQVPGDLSSAAFFLVAALCVPDSEVTLEGVGVNPTRAGILEVLQAMGADLTITSPREVAGEPVADITVRSSALKGIEIGGALVPRMIDEFPIFAVAAAMASGTSVVRDARELRVKESDRITRLVEELSRLGVAIQAREDGFTVEGGRQLRGATCGSHGDHRIAMAVAVAGLVAPPETVVHDVECVNTSCPGFWDLLDTVAPGAVSPPHTG